MNARLYPAMNAFANRQRLPQAGWWLIAGAVLLVWLQAMGRQLQRLWHLQNDHAFLHYLALARLRPDFYIVYSATMQILPPLLMLIVAGYLYRRQPRPGMAWLTSLTLLLLIIIVSPATLVLAGDTRWFRPILLLGVSGVISLTWVCTLFPTGATRHQSAGWVATGWSCLFLLLLVDPLRAAIPATWWFALLTLWFASMGAVRWLRLRVAGAPVERQINRWFSGALFAPLISFGIFHFISYLLRRHNATVALRTLYEINGMLFVLLLLTLMPLAMMLLIWRYRLWEIEESRRQRVHRLLSALLLLVYGLTVVLAQQSLLAFFDHLTAPFHVTLLALCVTALLWPGRQWGQRLCDTLLHPSTAAAVASAPPAASNTVNRTETVSPSTPLAESTLPVGNRRLTENRDEDHAKVAPKPPGEDSRLAAQGNFAQLSPREREVLSLIAAGLTNQQIAEALSITEGTVKRHTTHIYSKLGVQRRTQAVALVRGQQMHP